MSRHGQSKTHWKRNEVNMKRKHENSVERQTLFSVDIEIHSFIIIYDNDTSSKKTQNTMRQSLNQTSARAQEKRFFKANFIFTNPGNLRLFIVKDSVGGRDSLP